MAVAERQMTQDRALADEVAKMLRRRGWFAELMGPDRYNNYWVKVTFYNGKSWTVDLFAAHGSNGENLGSGADDVMMQGKS